VIAIRFPLYGDGHDEKRYIAAVAIPLLAMPLTLGRERAAPAFPSPCLTKPACSSRHDSSLAIIIPTLPSKPKTQKAEADRIRGTGMTIPKTPPRIIFEPLKSTTSAGIWRRWHGAGHALPTDSLSLRQDLKRLMQRLALRCRTRSRSHAPAVDSEKSQIHGITADTTNIYHATHHEQEAADNGEAAGSTPL
jgi:hypothetical protein